jgi:O-antigen/teichoic acid export membrane protein
LSQVLEQDEVATPQPKPVKSLRHSFSWTLAGNLIYAACQWGILVVMAKWMTPDIVGRFTLGIAITAPVFMFFNLNLRSVQATDARREYDFGEYLALRILMIACALVTIATIVLIVGYQAEILAAVLLIAVAKAWESLSDLFYGQLQHHEEMDRIAQSLVLKGLLSLLLFTAGILLSDNLLGGIVGLIIAQAVVWALFDLKNTRDSLKQTQEANSSAHAFRPLWYWASLRNLAVLSFPLGLVMLMISLNDNIPRYFVEHFCGERELGIFGALVYLMVAGNMLVNALGESSVARLARLYAAGDLTAFQQLIIKLTLVGATLGSAAVLGAWLIGRPFLTLLYQPEYAEYTELLVLLSIAAAIGCVQAFLSYGLGAARYYRIQVPIFLAVCLAITVASAVWIPSYQLNGAAYALMVGAAVRLVLTLVAMRHALQEREKIA